MILVILALVGHAHSSLKHSVQVTCSEYEIISFQILWHVVHALVQRLLYVPWKLVCENLQYASPWAREQKWLEMSFLGWFICSCVEFGASEIGAIFIVYMSMWIFLCTLHMWWNACEISVSNSFFVLYQGAVSSSFLLDMFQVNLQSPPWSWESPTVLNYSNVSKWLVSVFVSFQHPEPWTESRAPKLCGFFLSLQFLSLSLSFSLRLVHTFVVCLWWFLICC